MSDDSDHMENTPPTTSFSQMFSDPTADVVFQSSDHVQYRLHSRFLAATSGGLAVPDKVVVDGDPVELEEPSEVLDILFQFVEPPTEARNFRYPSMANVAAATLFPLAEAAEKYMVFPAMSSCAMAMHMLTTSHCFHVANHAYKHGYKDLLTKAAPNTFNPVDFEKAAKILTAPGLLAKWLLRYDGLRKVGTAGTRWFSLRRLCIRLCSRFRTLDDAFTRRSHHLDPRDLLSFREDIEGYQESAECPDNVVDCACEYRTQRSLDDTLLKAMAVVPSIDAI